MKRLITTLLLAAGLATSAQAETYAITNAVVHTMGERGVINGATVVIQDGKVAAVGRDVSVPQGAEVIDANGRVVTPGFFDPNSHLGLVEISAEDDTADMVTQSDRFTVAHAVADAVNPRSTLIPVNRIEGITRAVTRPYAGTSIFAGRSALISLGSVNEFMLRPHLAVHVTLGQYGAMLAGGSRGAALARLREALEDARDFARNRQAFERAERYDYALSRPDLVALQPVLEGRMPLVVDVNRASDIESVLRIAGDYNIRLVIAGGAEAWLVADKLAAANVPVILDPLQNLPSNFEMIASTLKNAALLHQSGVLIAFTQGGSHNARNVKQSAGNAVAHGLPWTAALQALTVNPAKIFGVQNYGELAAGFDADVVIWDGDPLEVTTYADQVFIQGRKIPMESRQTLLRDRYLSVDETRPQPYDKP